MFSAALFTKKTGIKAHSHEWMYYCIVIQQNVGRQDGAGALNILASFGLLSCTSTIFHRNNRLQIATGPRMRRYAQKNKT